MSESDKGRLTDLIGRIQKEFGKEAVSGSDIKVDWVHSGSYVLDLALGGGYPKGRIIEIFGPESSGKTTAALHLVAEIQKLGLAAGYIDVENALDLDYVKNLGVRLSENDWILSQPDTAEQAMEIIRAMCSFKYMGVVVLDSVAGLTPTARLQAEAGDQKVALIARLMSEQLNILKGICAKSGCILCLINQTRDKIGGGFGFGGDTTGTPGGKAIKFYTSQRINIARIGSDKEGEEVVANKTRVTVKKNKVAPPFRKADLVIRFGQGFDKVQEIVEMSVKHGVMQKKGSFYYYDNTNIGQGIAQVRTLLSEDSALLDDILEQLKTIIYADTKSEG